MSAICQICFTELRDKIELKEGKCTSCLTPSKRKFTEEAPTSKSDFHLVSHNVKNHVPSVYLGF
jgi:hypothetical protein